MKYFIATEKQEHIDSYKQLKAASIEVYRHFKAKAIELGFEAIGIADFDIPHWYFKRCEDQTAPAANGPRIHGFKGGAKYFESGIYYYAYQLSHAKSSARLIKDLRDGQPAMPEELDNLAKYAPLRRTIGEVLAVRLGLPPSLIVKASIIFSQAFYLSDKTLALMIPYNKDNPAIVPEGFKEISERALDELLDKHNAGISKDSV